jgi:hypothetical protein
MAATGTDGYDLTRIKALANAIGGILTDGAGVEPEDVGMLAFMIGEIVDRMEKSESRGRPGPLRASGPERAEPEAA